MPQVKKRFDWGYYTVPQKHAPTAASRRCAARCWAARAPSTGWSSSAATEQNYDDWADEGSTGWGYDDVLPAYKRLEDWEGGATEYRGAGGPIPVHERAGDDARVEAFVEALTETARRADNDDYNARRAGGRRPSSS